MRTSVNGLFQDMRIFVLLLSASAIGGCAGAGQGAVEGAASGALAGAASGLVSALVWGGDPGEHMARGATAGAAIGAVGGAAQGSQRAKAEEDYKAAQEQQEIEQFRRDIGNDAFDAVDLPVIDLDVARLFRHARHHPHGFDHLGIAGRRHQPSCHADGR